MYECICSKFKSKFKFKFNNNICNILHTILKKYFTFFSMIFLPCKQTIFLCKHLRYNLANRILTCQKDLSRK